MSLVLFAWKRDWKNPVFVQVLNLYSKSKPTPRNVWGGWKNSASYKNRPRQYFPTMCIDLIRWKGRCLLEPASRYWIGLKLCDLSRLWSQIAIIEKIADSFSRPSKNSHSHPFRTLSSQLFFTGSVWKYDETYRQCQPKLFQSCH